jgi:hypothetical protein
MAAVLPRAGTPPSDTADKIAKKNWQEKWQEKWQENRDLFSRKITSARKSEWELWHASEVRGGLYHAQMSVQLGWFGVKQYGWGVLPESPAC